MNKEPLQFGYWHFSLRPWRFFYSVISKNFWQVRIGWFQIDYMNREA